MTAGGSSSTAGGLKKIVVATALAGVGGYAITAVAAVGLGTDYARFAFFWSALYLVIGTLSGVQQEIARAAGTDRPSTSPRSSVLLLFSSAVALVATGAVAISSPFWTPAVFAPTPVPLTAALLVGTAAYVFVATVSGVFYGVKAWAPLSAIIVLDVALRLLLVVIGLASGADVVTIAWLTVVPLPILLAFAWLVARHKLRSASLDVALGSAFSNVARTLIAAGATSALVNGFPLFLGATSREIPVALLGALVFALVLTRAPLVVSTLALQSYLVVYLRDPTVHLGRVLAILTGALAAVGGLLALLAFLVGVDVIVWIAGEDFRLEPGFLALLVLSSVPTALVAVSGAMALSRSLHTYYAAGWVLSALFAIALLAIPADVFQRTLVALTVGPLLGFAVHLTGLRRVRPVP